MSPWAKFYAGREGASYREYVRKRYAPFINAIASRLNYHDLVLELGAGTGTISSILADYHTDKTHKVDATDVDPEMLDAINQRVGELNLDVAVYSEDAIKARSRPRLKSSTPTACWSTSTTTPSGRSSTTIVMHVCRFTTCPASTLSPPSETSD
jgi:SAM-dependent methyltransferase